jgi:hypothetical protein
VRERILGPDAEPDKLMDSDVLHTVLDRMGLEVERSRGRVVGASCQICGPVIGMQVSRSTSRQAKCDPEKHREFYDALEKKS